MKAVVYTRFSTDKQRDESIAAQLRAIELYAQKNNIEIIHKYVDEAKTATSDDRENFLKMIKELPSLKPNLVLVHKLDRFARNRYDAAIYRKELQKHGVRLVAVDQPIEDSPEGIILESLLEGMAEYYSKNLSKEVMKGMKENAYKAKYNGGWVPLGYDIDKDKNYIINKEESETIRLIFSMKLNGNSYADIATELNNLGKRTKQGKPFAKNSIHEILRNEKYCGTYTYNKTPKKVNGKRNNRIKKDESEIIRIEGAIPAIISKQEWMEVQQIMDLRKNGPRKRSDIDFMLAGLLTCADCGRALTSQSSWKHLKNGERKYTYYYVCNYAKRTGDCSNKKQYRKEQLENDVLDAIQNQIESYKDIEGLAEKLYKEIQIINNSKDDEQKILEKQLKKVNKELDNIRQAVLNGMDVKHLTDTFNELGQQKEQLEQKMQDKKSPFKNVTKKQIRQHILNQIRDIDRDDPEDCKKAITDYIESAIVSDKGIYISFKHLISGADKAGVGGTTLFNPHPKTA